MRKAVAYLRVSTLRQGASGLGMEAQQSAVEALCASQGLDLVAPPYVEVESGKRQDRRELAAALERAKLIGAVLVVAKLDRLARDAKFLLTCIDSGADVIFCDLPTLPAGPVGRFMLTQMAAVAELEAGLISQRTKAALAAAKARGVRLGNPNGAAALRRAGKGNAASTLSQSSGAQEFAERFRSEIERLRGKGVIALGAIANELNAQGLPTPRGGKWHASSVRNLVARLDAPKASGK